MSKHLVGGRRKREGKCEYVKEEETRERQGRNQGKQSHQERTSDFPLYKDLYD